MFFNRVHWYLFFSIIAQAVKKLYEALDMCEAILGTQRYMCGNTLTEADVRLFVTLIRFDEVLIFTNLNSKKPFNLTFPIVFVNKSELACCLDLITGLCSPFQMQQETGSRIPEFVQLHEGRAPSSGNGKLGEHGTHKATLLRKPSFNKPVRNNSLWPGNWLFHSAWPTQVFCIVPYGLVLVLFQ